MAKGKPTRRELKAPDEFISHAARAIQYAQAHRRLVSVSLAAALVLGGILWAYLSYRSARDRRAAEELVVLLQGPHEAAPFQKFLETYEGTSSAPPAWLYLAHAQYSKGDFAASLESYDRAAASRGSSAYLRQGALLGKAYSLVGLKQCEKAETFFRQFINLPGPLPKDDALLAMARCQEEARNSRAALDRYDEFLAKYPNSPLMTEGLRANVERLRKKVGGEK
jgi:tetratricopeptide (TPR) repeat protein